MAKINKFTAYLLLNPVGRCLRKVGGLATSAPGEFREGTQPPCSGAQTRLARQGCSTHVHAQMNARWEVGWGLGVGVVASIVPTGRPRSIQGPGFSHTHTLLLYSNALFHLHLIKRSAILFFFCLWLIASPHLDSYFAYPVWQLDGIVATRHVDIRHVGTCWDTAGLVCIWFCFAARHYFLNKHRNVAVIFTERTRRST